MGIDIENYKKDHKSDMSLYFFTASQRRKDFRKNKKLNAKAQRSQRRKEKKSNFASLRIFAPLRLIIFLIFSVFFTALRLCF